MRLFYSLISTLYTVGNKSCNSPLERGGFTPNTRGEDEACDNVLCYDTARRDMEIIDNKYIIPYICR